MLAMLSGTFGSALGTPRGLGFAGEADRRLGGWFWFRHQITDGVDDLDNLLVVTFEPALQFVELGGQFLMRGEVLADAHKGEDNQHADLYGFLAAQDVGGHDDAVLGEGIG